VAYTGSWETFLKVWVIPQLLTGSLQTTSKFLEHLGMPGPSPHEATRTIIPASRIETVLAMSTFQNTHQGLHHRYPGRPAIVVHSLSRKRDYVRTPGHVQAFKEVFSALWAGASAGKTVRKGA
jgi:hypothetical protein